MDHAWFLQKAPAAHITSIYCNEGVIEISVEKEIIKMSHGDGGLLTHQLLRETFFPLLGNKWLNEEADSAVLDLTTQRIALTTDSFVVSPLFFPGGDIGRLSVYGTVNDLVVCGAKPAFLSASFIIAEGMEKAKLAKVVQSLSIAANELDLPVVAGDTKVVESNNPDNLFINTTGIGQLLPGVNFYNIHPEPSDLVIVTGTIGDHGAAILSARLGLETEESPPSDCAPLVFLLDALKPVFPHLKGMRDPTRGGVATTLKEIAEKKVIDINLDEEAIPINPKVKAVSDILGIDPLYLACEGRALMIVRKEASDMVLQLLKSCPQGREACVIGNVEQGNGSLYLNTALGGTRSLKMLAGKPLPRIC